MWVKKSQMNEMICKKCGNPLPREGFVCKFCGAMMDEKQIAQQKEYMKTIKKRPILKSELYGMEKINYPKEKNPKISKGVVTFILISLIIFLIILAIIIL